MFYALSWFFVLALLALWSLAAWAMNSLAVWAMANAGTLTQAASGASPIALPDWLAPWVPSEAAQWASQLLAGLAPMADGLLQAAPSMMSGFTVFAWVVWAVGSLLLVLLGAWLHLFIALWRRSSGRGSEPRATSELAAGGFSRPHRL